MFQIRREEPDSGVQTGSWGIEHRFHPERFRDGDRLHRSCPARGNQDIVARINALLHRDEVKRAGHLRIGDIDDRLRRLDFGESRWLGSAIAYGFLRKTKI